MSEAANAGQEPWTTEFDDEISDWDDGTVEYALATMLKDFLLSNGDSTAADTARRINEFYDEEYLPSDPLMKFEDDRGMAQFLSTFYEFVYTLARLIPYNSSNQENLVRLLLELRRLPPRQFKIWKEDCVVWTREPVSVALMDDYWNGNYRMSESFYLYLQRKLLTNPKPATDAKERSGGDGKHSFQEVCDEWVNFSCFIARCIAAGLNDSYVNGCKYPIIDVPEGLEKDLPRGPKRDCLVMVAAQYILLAGRTLANYGFKEDSTVFGPKWRRWAEKLAEISRQEGGDNRLASIAEDARKYMMSLRPEIFLPSGDG